MSILLFSRSAATLSHQSFLVICAVGLLCCLAPAAKVQRVNVTIRVVPGMPGRVVIEGNCAPARTWSFRNNYAGVSDLADRIGELKLANDSGADVAFRKTAAGQFESTTPASRFSYEVKLISPVRASDAAMVSWVNEQRGLLVLGDLLPTFEPRVLTAGSVANISRANRSLYDVSVKFDLPAGWQVYSNERRIGETEFETIDPGQVGFAIGKHLRQSERMISEMTLSLIADGQWAFDDADALELAEKVLKAHRDVFGATPTNRATLILFPFPQPVAADKWSAETRGSTVTLLMGKLPSKTAAMAQLSVPLTHELFHLWIPNGLALEGDYDWFYEGFTIYQAARTSVRLGYSTFQEFLNGISRAYDTYSASGDRDRWSLVEASRRRWTVGESSVYSKSMVLAFLYDLKLRTESHGKRSLDDVYRKLFREYRSSEGLDRASAQTASDGNSAATDALVVDAATQSFVRSFISEPVAINLERELSQYGLRVEKFGLRTHIGVSERLSKQQRDSLRGLGYNNYAR